MGALGIVVTYVVIVLVGLIPVNNDFRPTPDGIQIFVLSNPVHADIILPLRTETIDWRTHFPDKFFSGDTRQATHVAIGWGDKGFYLETPTWADLKVSTASKALFWPSESCMHVTMTRAEYLGPEARSVTISNQQYQQLVQYVLASFTLDKNHREQRLGTLSYGPTDAFFEAHGRYHCLNTCNCWVGRGLRAAGIRTACFTPLPKTVFLYLPPERNSQEHQETTAAGE